MGFTTPEEHPHFATKSYIQIDLSKREIALHLVALSHQTEGRPTPNDAAEIELVDPQHVSATYDTWQAAFNAAGLGD